MIWTKDDHANFNESEQFKRLEKEIDILVNFFKNLSGLISYNGRPISFRAINHTYFLDTDLLDSSVQTLNSIRLCCSIGSFSDANTLIRKLRDDLLLYVYIIEISRNRKTFIEEDIQNLNLEDADKFLSTFMELRFNPILTDDEKAVEAWLGNKVHYLNKKVKMKLSFENYMQVLQKNDRVTEMLKSYNLQEYWGELRTKLNGYVHNNGKLFTHHNLGRVDNKALSTHLTNISYRASYISSLFLIILLMVDSSLISSTDMIDYLDSDIEPPEGCQYQIANFIQEFIDTKVIKLHPELKQYLKDHNISGMIID